MVINIPDDGIRIISAYEGLGGKKPDGKYYPYQGAADRPNVLTIGRGHVLTAQEKSSGIYNDGLTLDEVNELFEVDLQPRAHRLKLLMKTFSVQEFAAAISFFYNIEKAWGPNGSPGNYHRANEKVKAAKSFLLYIKSGNPLKKRLGLWRRRATEALYYLSGNLIIAKDSATDKALITALASEGISTNIP